LEDGSVDVGVLFSTDAVLGQGGLVVLEDDQGMSAADNVFPVASQEVADAYGSDLSDVLDAVSAELDTDGLIELNSARDVDHEDADAIASAWLDDHPDIEGMVDDPGDGPALSFGAQDFGESEILSEIYSQALEANGFESGTTGVGGFRDLLFGAFESGDVNIAIDYVASELEYLNENAGEATHDVEETFGLLEPLLDERSLVGFTPAEAVNTNVFVVTEDFSEENGVTTLSDLAG
jgi:osmoprotectant transport system substrate-binding protein